MQIPRYTKTLILKAYKDMAHTIYQEQNRISRQSLSAKPQARMPTTILRMMILDTISGHILSQTRKDITEKNRVTKNKVTREAKKVVAKIMAPEAKEMSF